MKSRATIAVFFSILAASLTAVAQGPAPSASVPAPTAPPQEAAKPPMPANRQTSAAADPRLCLEFPANLDVIKCAEKYRNPNRNR